MNKKYNRRETWENSHGGSPVKCILDVSKNLRYFLDQLTAQDGLTCIQMRVLGHIHMEEIQGRSVFQRDIEEIFRIRRSSVTSVLQTLERKGLIFRECVPGDARLKKLVLTDRAKEMNKDTYAVMNRMEQGFRALFTEEEFRIFLDYMNRIDRKAMDLLQQESLLQQGGDQ